MGVIGLREIDGLAVESLVYAELSVYNWLDFFQNMFLCNDLDRSPQLRDALHNDVDTPTSYCVTR